MKTAFAVLIIAFSFFGLGTIAQATITIDTVSVGDAGNAADTEVVSDGTTGTLAPLRGGR